MSLAIVFALLAAALGFAAPALLRSNPAVPSGPSQKLLLTYTALPSADPLDGKFMAVAGEGMQSLAGFSVVAFIGVPAGSANFEFGIFDGDTGGHWDTALSLPTLIYKLYTDRLKNGSTADLVWQGTSDQMVDNDWYNVYLSTSNNAKAPSGNYFYRLEANWADPQSTSFNSFKIRTTGQISLRAGQEFGFDGGPQNPPFDPCVGSWNNTYDGSWNWFFYVPTTLDKIGFRDGDFDRWDDPVSPGQPPDDADPSQWNACTGIHPSVYYTVTDPDGHVYNDSNPSGNTVWENFTIGPNPGDNYVINYTLKPGLWNLHVVGLDAHNFAMMKASYEVFSNPQPPLPVNPPPLLAPDNTGTTPSAGVTMQYGHNVTNEGAPDSFDLGATSAHAWATRIYYDANGNGKVDPNETLITSTPTLGANQSYPIVVQLDVPPSVNNSMTDITTVIASSRTEWALQDTAADTTRVLLNQPPVANAGGPYTALEGSPINFDASASRDPDGDNLTFRWDFNNDGTFDTAWSSNPISQFKFGDDWVGKARVEVSDGQLMDNATANVTVRNVPPTIAMTVIPGGNEGDTLTFKAHATDPGSDDLTFTWGGSCTGWSAPRIYYNNGVSPDPYPSPDVHPRDVWDNQSVVCGDNGQYAWSLTVRDDDGGVARASGTFSIDNLPPAFTASPPSVTSVDEGSMVSFNATARDPGSDDLTFEWAWEYGPTATAIFYNNGVSPDPANSPNGTYPFFASDSSSFIYGHEGNFSMTLTVTDDDGGFITYTTVVDVSNVAPTVQAGPDVTIDEGSSASVSFSFSDPGFDMPQAGLYENFTATVDWGYAAWPPESVSVVKVPGGPGVATTGSVNLTRIYGDNGLFPVTLTVCDDANDCGSASLFVTVLNVPPVIQDVQAYATANLTVRVSGEKWHDVRMDLVWNGDITGSARVVRYPGSPDRQQATIEGGRIQLIGDFSIVLYYTPADDPINGQLNGANPVWVVIVFPDGLEVVLKHNFNVQHPSSYVWTIGDLRPYLVGQVITFSATAGDVGSDDLTFTWSFGDGSPDASTIYYNNGIGPDPFPSPEYNPITVTDMAEHAYASAGTYTASLTVSDDDGGSVSLSFTFGIGR